MTELGTCAGCRERDDKIHALEAERDRLQAEAEQARVEACVTRARAEYLSGVVLSLQGTST